MGGHKKPYKIFFETMSNKVRWDIVHLLNTEPYRATEIAKNLHYEQSLVSHHLKRLEVCGFVSVKEKGTERIYTLNKKTIQPLLKLADKHISEFCKNRQCDI